MTNKYIKKLNRQEERFTAEFIRHGDRVRAWRKAYPKIMVDEDKIYNLATTMLNAAHIKAELKQYLTDTEIKYGISKTMILKELKSIAFFDIAEIFDEFGNLKSAAELKDAGRVISEILVSTQKDEMGAEIINRKVKLSNKLTAIDMISKMMGYYAPEEHRIVDEEGNDVVPQMTVVFEKFSSIPDGDYIHRQIEDGQGGGEPAETLPK